MNPGQKNFRMGAQMKPHRSLTVQQKESFVDMVCGMTLGKHTELDIAVCSVTLARIVTSEILRKVQFIYTTLFCGYILFIISGLFFLLSRGV